MNLLNAVDDLFSVPELSDMHLFQFCSYKIYVIFLFQTFPKRRKKKEIGKKSMKKLLCVPIVMCFSLLLLQLAANILSHSLTISFPLCLCPEPLRMRRMAKEQ
jgi:hypothetical protein